MVCRGMREYCHFSAFAKRLLPAVLIYPLIFIHLCQLPTNKSMDYFSTCLSCLRCKKLMMR